MNANWDAINFELERKSELIAQLTAELEERTEERDNLQVSFDLRWKADMRAIKAWQTAHPGSDLVWPDHVDLCLWLMEQLNKATGEKS
jgi:hypothetical protein